MGNMLRQGSDSQNQLEVKAGDPSEKSLSPPSGKIKGRFKQEKEFSIQSPSDARKLMKNRSRFYKTLLDCILLDPGKLTETFNTFVTAFKDRKLASQVLSPEYFIGRDEDLRRFAVALNSQRNVSALVLHFYESPKLTKQGMKFLALRLRRMYLSELKISFGLFSRISVEGLSPLFSGLKHLTCLSSLTLDLQYEKPLKLPAIKELVSSLKGMRRLERLRISVKYSLIEEEVIEELFSGLGKLKRISHLSFDFSHSGIFNKSLFNNLPVMLTSLKCLTSLELVFDFHLSGEKNQIITHISSGLKSLTFLKNLTLSLLPQVPGYVESGVESLSEALREIKSLQKLDLHFSVFEFNKQYQDKLSLGLKDLKMLKHFSLFLNFNKVSDQDIEEFSLVFENMKALNVLQLKFTGHKFDKKIIHIFCKNLKRVASLKHFFLEICSKDGLNEIEKKKFISKFRDVRVELINRASISEWCLHFYL